MKHEEKIIGRTSKHFLHLFHPEVCSVVLLWNRNLKMIWGAHLRTRICFFKGEPLKSLSIAFCTLNPWGHHSDLEESRFNNQTVLLQILFKAQEDHSIWGKEKGGFFLILSTYPTALNTKWRCWWVPKSSERQAGMQQQQRIKTG